MKATPRFWSTIKHGVALGLLGSLTASVMLVPVLFITGVLSTVLSRGVAQILDPLSIAYAFLSPLAVGMAVGAITFIPAALAGGFDALVLYVLSRTLKAPAPVGVFTGALSGVLFATPLVVVGSLAASSGSDLVLTWRDLPGLAATYAIPALVGIWHGWRMVRYLHGAAAPTVPAGTENAAVRRIRQRLADRRLALLLLCAFVPFVAWDGANQIKESPYTLCLRPPRERTPGIAYDRFVMSLMHRTYDGDFAWLANVSEPAALEQLRELQPTIDQWAYASESRRLAGFTRLTVLNHDRTWLAIDLVSDGWPQCPDFDVTGQEIVENIRLKAIERSASRPQ